MTMKSLKYSEREDMMDGFSPVPPPLPRRQPVRNIYAEPFVDPRYRQKVFSRHDLHQSDNLTSSIYS
ncbi:Type II transmembrane protein [Operophtera brumata]|uniref:Type II transmembrane protein n=1 Tax=Operophtera brumata TaxID=104452 RepID=A0A0L7LNM3_OPEBR|nr:Type II transmembrane protein [Operophtera brumata]